MTTGIWRIAQQSRPQLTGAHARLAGQSVTFPRPSAGTSDQCELQARTQRHRDARDLEPVPGGAQQMPLPAQAPQRRVACMAAQVMDAPPKGEAAPTAQRAKVQGRTVIVTGGSQGVGKVLARKFAQQGYNVVVVARQADRLQAVADDLAELVPREGGAIAVPTDITSSEDVGALAERVLEQFEDVDVVVNNAGACLTGTFSATAVEDFRAQMDVNFFGAVAVTSAFLPALKRTAQRRSRTERPVVAIVNSFASRLPLPNMAAYSASKAALASFADAVRPELALSGIHLAQVQPGVINSDFLERAQWRGEAAKESQKQMEQMLETSSFAQTPQQVADAVFSAVTKYKREVTVGLPFKATLAAAWLGLNPASALAKSE